jgi:hypothetical protein
LELSHDPDPKKTNDSKKCRLKLDTLLGYDWKNTESHLRSLLRLIGYDIDELTRNLEGVAITVEEIAEGVQAIRLTVRIAARLKVHADWCLLDRAAGGKNDVSSSKGSENDR